MRFLPKRRSTPIQTPVSANPIDTASSQAQTGPSPKKVTKPIEYIHVTREERAEINKMIKMSADKDAARTFQERRRSKVPSNGDLPQPQTLTRMSSETREINSLVFMISGQDANSKEMARQMMRERRTSKKHDKAKVETQANSTGVNKSISSTVEEMDQQSAKFKDQNGHEAGHTYKILMRTAARAGVAEGDQEQTTASSCLQRRLAWRRAFEQAKLEAPALKRVSSEQGASPPFKRSSSTSTVVTVVLSGP